METVTDRIQDTANTKQCLLHMTTPVTMATCSCQVQKTSWLPVVFACVFLTTMALSQLNLMVDPCMVRNDVDLVGCPMLITYRYTHIHTHSVMSHISSANISLQHPHLNIKLIDPKM